MIDQWLVRTAENWIAGPYSSDQVCQMIREGKLTLQDEVCLANQYWVFLHEREEIKRFLGIDVPKAHLGSDEEEITETAMIYEDNEPTDPELLSHSKANQNTILNESLEQSQTENTAVINTAGLKGLAKTSGKKSFQNKSTASPNTSQRRPRPGTSAAAVHSFHQVEIVGQIEKPSLWRGLAWILVISSAFLIGGMVWWIRR